MSGQNRLTRALLVDAAAVLLAAPGTTTPNATMIIRRMEVEPLKHKGALSTRHIKPYFRQNERY